MIKASRLRSIYHPRVAAFSLVEVVIAMAIVSVTLIVMIGLIPLGLKASQNSEQESQAANLLQMITADRVNSSSWSNSYIYQLPPVMNSSTNPVSSTLWINEDGITTSSTQCTSSQYRLSYTLYPVTNVSQPALLDLKLSLANSSTNQPSSLEALVSVSPQ